MKHMLHGLMEKPEAKEKDDSYDAKMKVLEELRDMAMEMMGEKVKGKLLPKSMKQVSVAAPDEESLAEGLDLAKEALSEDESEEDESEEDSEESLEDIDAKIKELQAKKAMLASR